MELAHSIASWMALGMAIVNSVAMWKNQSLITVFSYSHVNRLQTLERRTASVYKLRPVETFFYKIQMYSGIYHIPFWKKRANIN